jgi:hypothetical protein
MIYHASQMSLFQPALAEKFEEFDKTHPDIWGLFVQLTFQLIQNGRDHFGAQAILEKMRYDFATSTQGQIPKINNNWASFYSRKWAREYPKHAEFFERRKSVADQAEAA